MRRSARGRTAALLLVGLMAALGAAMPVTTASSATPAGQPAALQAAAAAPKVVQSNWFWYQQESSAPVSGIDLPEPSGVPAGDLAVAFTNGQGSDQPDEPSKQTFLAFDLSGVPSAATVTTFTFTVTVDVRAAQVHGPQPVLMACLPLRGWENGEGSPASAAPPVDCSTAIAAVGDYNVSKRTYTFAVPSMAQRWVSDVNTGVAIRQSAEQTAPFQVVFTGPATVTSSLAYVPPAPQPPSSSPVPSTGPGAPPATDSGGSGGSALSGGTSGGVPSNVDEVAPGGVSTAPAPSLAPTPPPLAAAPAAAGSAPSLNFWLVGLAVLGVLILISLVLGDTSSGTPAAAAPPRRPNRLDRALRARAVTLTQESP